MASPPPRHFSPITNHISLLTDEPKASPRRRVPLEAGDHGDTAPTARSANAHLVIVTDVKSSLVERHEIGLRSSWQLDKTIEILSLLVYHAHRADIDVGRDDPLLIRTDEYLAYILYARRNTGEHVDIIVNRTTRDIHVVHERRAVTDIERGVICGNVHR